MPEMNLGDVTIHYDEAGQGPLAFVYCHGLGGEGDSFVEEFDFWNKQFGRVVTWDHRGLGRSSQAAKYSLPLYASDLARLLDGLGIQRAVVLGVSWGGVLVQQFALDYLGKCAAIILDSTTSEVNAAASAGWYRQGEDARQSSEGARSVRPEHMDSFVASARGVAGLREHPYTPRLQQITCPALIVAGGQDATTGGAGGSVIMSRNLPNARLQIFQDTGHGVYRLKRDEFRALVLEFCRQHGILKG